MYFLRLFGGVSVEDSSGAAPAGIVYQRSLAVLALLAVARDKGCSRDKLIGYLWAESDQERARHRLSDTVYMLRKSLGEEAVVLTAGGYLRLNPDVVESDAGAFLEALDAGELQAAAELYDGPLLDGFYTSGAPEFERWAESERQRFAEAYANALERLAEQAEAASEYRRAVEWWKRLAAQDPYNSRYALGLMEAMARSGDPANAIQIAQEHERLLKEELDADPVPEVLALAVRLRREAGEFADAVELPALRMTPTGAASSAEPGIRPIRARLRLPVAIYATVSLGIVVAGLTWYVGWGRSSGPVADRKSVAVLPFVNVGDDPEREYFSDGITDEIITRLGKVADLKVISRTSVMQYKNTDKNLRQIGEELGVATVVEGQVLQIGDRVRINAQLVDAKTDIHLWADQYERQVTDIFDIHSDIAKRIVTALQVTLTPVARERIERRPTEDLEAYDLYLLGRHRYDLRGFENLRDAIRFFEAAIEQDSAFALAWAGLADAWAALLWSERYPPREAYARRGRDAAQRALDLDEGMAEAHTALGGLALYYDWKWDRAEAHLLRAVELKPNWALGHFYLGMVQYFQGRKDRGIKSLRTAVSLNPLGDNFHSTLAGFLYDAGRVEEALAIWHTRFPSAVYFSLALIQQGRAEDALRVIQRWGEAEGYPNPERLELVLRAIEAPELTEGALGVLEDVRRTTGVRVRHLAALYLNLDAPAEALRIVKELISQRDPIVPFLGMALTRAGALRNAEIMAALQEAGAPIK